MEAKPWICHEQQHLEGLREQMKALQRQVVIKEWKMGPMQEKRIMSEDCSNQTVEGYDEYDANYGELEALYKNQDDQGFPESE